MLSFFSMLRSGQVGIKRYNTTLHDLHQAAMRNDGERISLLAKKCDVNVKTSSGNTALALAFVRMRGEKAISALLEVPGVKIDNQDILKNTPLHFAIRNPSVSLEMIAKLVHTGLQVGVKMNLPDHAGNTPFFEAVSLKRFDVVEMLLGISEFRDDPATGQVLTLDDNHALYHAMAQRNKNFVKMILSYPEVTAHPSYDKDKLSLKSLENKFRGLEI